MPVAMSPPVRATAWPATDLELMDSALDHARSALGRVRPNPAVGAVVARDGRPLGAGCTQPPPGAHAEVMALRAAGAAARDADLYVTLEPCPHSGRTPPCTEAILAAGLRRVVVGTLDPSPAVDGRGVERLRAAGLDVEVGCRHQEAEELVGGFAMRVRHHRPLTLAKYAMTLDGRIATRSGHSRWISGAESRADGHLLRDRLDAILVGVGTVLADDPRLTTRLDAGLAGYGGPHHPLRVVLDSELRTPPDARLVDPDAPGRTRIYTTERAPEERARRLRSRACDVVRVGERGGRVDPAAVLADLAALEINDLLIEGGGRVLGSFFDLGLVDRVRVYVAPVIVGGDEAPGPVAGLGVETMPAAWRLLAPRVRRLGADLVIEGRVARDGETDGV